MKLLIIQIKMSNLRKDVSDLTATTSEAPKGFKEEIVNFSAIINDNLKRGIKSEEMTADLYHTKLA